MPRRAVRGLRLPAVPLFVAWVLAVLALSRPWSGVSLRSLLLCWRPDLPASAFGWGHLAATAARVAAGEAGAVAVVVALLGLGAAVLPLLVPGGRRRDPDRVAWSFGIGALAGIAGWFGLGLCGLWGAQTGWAAAAGGWALGWRGRREWSRTRGPGARDEPPWLRGVFGAAVAIALLLGAAAVLTRDSVYDAVTYHLPIAARFAREHRIVGLGHLVASSYPLGGPVLWGWLITLGGEPAVRAWRGWLLAGLCLLVRRMAVREGYPVAGLVAAAAVATLPLVLWIAPATMPDIESAALVLLAAFAARRSAAPGAPGAGLASVLVAGACAIRYQAVCFVPAVVAAGCRWRPWRRPRTVAFAAAFVLAALAPFWIRNAVVVGNPFHPYADRLIPPVEPGFGYPKAGMMRAQRAFVISSPARIAEFPWRVSTGGREPVSLGPAVLLSVPLLVLVPVTPAAAGYAAMGAVSLCCWIGVSHNQRYWIATWALFIIAAAIAGDEARRRRVPIPAIWAAAIGACAALGLARALPAALPGVSSILLGRDDAAARWARTTVNDYTRLAEAASSRMPPSARVLLVGDFRAAYWGRPVVSQIHEDVPLLERLLASSRNAAEAAKRIRQVAPAVYVNDAEVARLEFYWRWHALGLSPRDAAVAREVWSRWMEPVARTGPAAVWRLRSHPAKSAGPVPLAFDRAALAAAYAGPASVSWEGAGRGSTKAPAR